MVYTYVGDIVISVNPFKNTGCTGSAIRAKYKGGQRSHLPPHIYALVDQTYSTMVRDGNSQSILISGESGAGKTEAMKICLTFIGQVSQAKGERVASEVAPSSVADDLAASLAMQLAEDLASTPELLGAFVEQARECDTRRPVRPRTL